MNFVVRNFIVSQLQPIITIKKIVPQQCILPYAEGWRNLKGAVVFLARGIARAFELLF